MVEGGRGRGELVNGSEAGKELAFVKSIRLYDESVKKSWTVISILAAVPSLKVKNI